MENNQTTNIELDKIELFVPKAYYSSSQEIPKYSSFMGLNISLYDNGMYLSVSGKLNSTPNSFGKIIGQNIDQTFDKIQKLSGISINKNYFMNKANVCVIHLKKDTIVDDLPEYYISELKELFKRNTDKYDVYKYSDLTYKQGLTLIPKDCGLVLLPKPRKRHRFSIYVKGTELKKPENKEYRDQFSYDFLMQADKILRLELQIRSFEEMRKFFNLSEDAVPTISNILNSNSDPVWDFFNTLINKYTKEGE